MKTHRYILVCLIILLMLAGCNSPNNTTNKAAKKNIPTIELQGKLISSSISPDMKLLALVTESKKGKSKQLLLISLSSKKLIARTEVESAEIYWSDDSKRLAFISGPEGEIIVVMSKDGRLNRFNVSKSVGGCKFRHKDSNKLLYTLSAEKKVKIFELNVETSENRMINIAKTDQYPSLTTFKEKDCCSITSFSANMVYSLDVDTGKTLLSIPITDFDDAWASFSPDSKYTAIQWRGSSTTFLTIGRIEDAHRLISHRYIGSYSRYDFEAFYKVKWLPSKDKQRDRDRAIIDTYGTSTLVDLSMGHIDLIDYPAHIHWYKNPGYDSDLLVVNKQGIRTDMINNMNNLKYDLPIEDNNVDYIINFAYPK